MREPANAVRRVGASVAIAAALAVLTLALAPRAAADPVATPTSGTSCTNGAASGSGTCIGYGMWQVVGDCASSPFDDVSLGPADSDGRTPTITVENCTFGAGVAVPETTQP